MKKKNKPEIFTGDKVFLYIFSLLIHNTSK
jgi:hypothetical protein